MVGTLIVADAWLGVEVRIYALTSARVADDSSEGSKGKGDAACDNEEPVSPCNEPFSVSSSCRVVVANNGFCRSITLPSSETSVPRASTVLSSRSMSDDDTARLLSFSAENIFSRERQVSSTWARLTARAAPLRLCAHRNMFSMISNARVSKGFPSSASSPDDISFRWASASMRNIARSLSKSASLLSGMDPFRFLYEIVFLAAYEDTQFIPHLIQALGS